MSGNPGEEDAQAVLGLWEESGVLTGEAARQRLSSALCVLRDAEGRPAGVSWAVPDELQLVGNRRFWMYSSVLAAGHEEADPALISHSFEALQGRFDSDSDDPIGLCVVLRDPDEIRRRPEAEWTDPHMLYVGFLPDGGQVRVGYFEGARI